MKGLKYMHEHTYYTNKRIYIKYFFKGANIVAFTIEKNTNC